MILKSRSTPLWSGAPIAVVFLTIFYFATMEYMGAPGISEATAIDPYMNGTFSSETPGNGAGEGNWNILPAYPNLTFADPIAMIQDPDSSSFFVAGKPGFVWRISMDSTTTTKQTILDISDRVHTDGDAGLVNIILHPEFGDLTSSNRGYIYIIYRYHPLGDAIGNCDALAYTRLSRFTKADGVEIIDTASEFVLIQQFDPHCWHTGGGMFFDGDGFLYFTFGDAGGTDDPFNTSQQIDSSFFGGLHRIDVDQDLSRSHVIIRQPKDVLHPLLVKSFSQGYTIPNDNPWVDPSGNVLEEFYALGLRSPHRASMDPATQKIWISDVGEGSREEISVVSKGDNLQWPFREGSIAGPRDSPTVILGNSRDPVFDYNHSVGNAVIGGFVYRGIKFNTILDGKYIFGDHGTRNVWSFNPNTEEVTFLAHVPSGGSGSKNGISSFATDYDGNVYVLKLYGTDLDGGVIYKMDPGRQVPEPPQLLSQTGAFSDLSNLTPTVGFIPYDVNAPLWSDGAEKKRWVAIPNNGSHNTVSEQVVFSPTTPWVFPEGTVFMKHFELPIDDRNPTIIKRIETRFIIVKGDGGIYGMTYKWNEDDSDAELLYVGDTASYNVTLNDGSQRTQIWAFPSRADCQTCHNTNAGLILGPKTWQLNGDFEYPSLIVDNQLNTWDHLNIFSNGFSPEDIDGFLKSFRVDDESATLDSRVRSYIDANCSHCHQPNGVNGVFDARYAVTIDQQNLLFEEGIGVNTPSGHMIIRPRDHEASELWQRDNSIGDGAMPPLAKNLIDTSYISVLTSWINSLHDSTCYTTYLSDLSFAQAPINGWGPVELDRSNGSMDANDGSVLSIAGVSFEKGLGTHSDADLHYDLNAGFKRFEAFVGIDDATCGSGSVRFYLYVDDSLVFQSPVMESGDEAAPIDIDITGAMTMQLVVDDGGDGKTCDHANWGLTRLTKSCDDGDECTVEDTYDGACNCVGTLIDANENQLCDSLEFQLAIRVMLEGALLDPFSGEEFLMRDDLRSRGFLPSTSPYADSLSCHDSVFLKTGPDAIVDWIWIEFRDPLDTITVNAEFSGLLQRDGDIVSVDGESAIMLDLSPGDYFLRLKHRNHLSLMSATTLMVGRDEENVFDFSNGSLSIYGLPTLPLIEGFYVAMGADADGSDTVDATDRSETWNNRNNQIYGLSDCNMDSFIDASDRAYTWNSRNRAVFLPRL